MRATICGVLIILVVVTGGSQCFGQISEQSEEVYSVPAATAEITIDLTENIAILDLGVAVVSGNMSLETIIKDTRAITVINGEEISGITSIGDVLERVPGLDVRLLGGHGQPATAQIRGSRSGQLRVLIDGSPINVEGTFDLTTLPLFGVDRIEVIRGPEAARFGVGALAGVINIVTAHSLHPQPSNELDGVSTSATLNTTDPGVQRSNQTWTGSHGLTGTMTNYRDSASSSSYSYEEAENDYSYPRPLAGTAGVRKNNHYYQHRLFSTVNFGADRFQIGFSHLRRGVSGSAEFPTLKAKSGRDGLWSQYSTPGWLGSVAVERFSFNDPEPYLNAGAISTTDLKLHAEAAFGSLRTFKSGFGFKPRFDYTDGTTTGIHSRGGLDLAYLSDGLFGSRRIEAEAAVVASTDFGLDPSVRIGYSFDLTENLGAYVSAGYSVRHPSFSELYLSNMGSIRGDPDLTAERLYSGETGLNWRGAQTALEASVFYSHYEDSVIFAPVSGYLVEAINTGPATVAGIEALVDHSISDQLWFRTAGTWLTISEFDSGVPLTGRAEYHINSRLEYLASEWQAAITADLSGETPADLFGNLVIQPRLLAGLELSHRFDNNELAINVSNILNKHSRDNWNYPLPGREYSILWRINL